MVSGLKLIGVKEIVGDREVEPRILRTSFHESKPRVLVEMQQTHWMPLLEWLKETHQIDLKVYHDSILFSKQSSATHSKLRSIVASFDPLKLAGASPTHPSIITPRCRSCPF
jgi:hypothetical protein